MTAATGSGTLVVITPEGGTVPNLGVAALLPGRQPWGPEGGRVAAELAGSAGKSAALSLRIGGRPPRQQLATRGASASLASGTLSPGWWPVRAELEPDELRLDDARETAVRVAPAARASWRAEDRFLATACEVLEQNGRLVRGGDLLIGTLGQGASIVQPPADAATLGALNRTLASRGVAWRFGDPAAGSGVTDSGSAIGRHQVTRRYTLVPAGNSAGTGVLVSVGGAPWVVRSGNTILLGSRLEPLWTELPLAAEFVPFVDYLANRAIQGELALLDAAPGEPVLLPDAATAVIREGRRRPVEGGGAFRAGETGLHFILAGNDTIGVVGVNPDPRESALERAAPNALRRLWPGARLGPPSRAGAMAFTAGGQSDLRGPFLWLAAVLALTDAALAGLGARGRERS